MLRFLLISVVVLASEAYAAEQVVKLSTEPERPLVEVTRLGSALNFDVLVENTSAMPLTLSSFEVTLRDSTGQMIMRRKLDGNGGTIDVVPQREVAPRAKLLIFNPLPLWPADVAVDRFELTLELSDANGNATTAHQIVRPQLYEPRTPLRLPSDATLFVHAGHDLLAHHRRFPLHSALTERLGIAHNVTRYAYDFVVIDERGETYRGDGTKRSDWYGFGTPVLAPAAGVVVETFNDQPDNDFGQPPRLEAKVLVENPKRLFGNYILIDHGNGEFGLLAHLKQGSVEVRPGQRVTAGQKLGAIGMSGDA